MNTESNQEENTVLSTGDLLSATRKRLGISQEIVAERLCLKVSTVKDMEEDKSPPDLAPTFLRGYIRSYARLLHIPEEKILPASENRATMSKVQPMRSFSLNRENKKQDDRLVILTWIVVAFVIGLMFNWWWQKNKGQHEEIYSMISQHTNTMESDPDKINSSLIISKYPKDNTHTLKKTINQAIKNSPHDKDQFLALSQKKNSNRNKQEENLKKLIRMQFNADCWLEVLDSDGRKLFSGIQCKDGILNLTGQALYQLSISTPTAVNIRHQDRFFNISSFLKNQKIAHLTLHTG